MPPNPKGFGTEAALLAARRVPTAAVGGEKDAYARIAATSGQASATPRMRGLPV